MKAPLRVLLIDDDDVDRMAIRRALRSTGLDVIIEEVDTSDAALEMLIRNSFDCVFLDYLLPGTDGLQVLRKTRAAGNDVPIIMLTGRGDEELAVELIQAGASDYVSKSRMSAAVLARSIHNTIRLHRAELERKQAESELRKSNEKISDILESIGDDLFAIDRDGRFAYVNTKAEMLLAERREALLGKTICDHLPDSVYWLRDNLRKAMKEGLPVHLEGFFKPREVWLESHIYPHEDGLSVYFRDITERKQAEERLSYMANHDVLTGVANRALLMDRLRQALMRAPWHNRTVAVLFCDLDRFKLVNDSLGHATGDKLLQLVAKRLINYVRDGDTVARLGGDEFVIVLADVAKIEDAKCVAQQLFEVMSQPFEIGQEEITVTASIGISLFPHDGHDADMLLTNADAAMYRAKDQGRNTYELYSPAMTAHASARLSLERELRRALEQQEFRLHYHPIIDLRSGDLIGAEALLRWEHSELGALGPDEFLPLAEENGLIVPIGEWVLRAACAQNKAWQQLALPPIAVTVNLSNRQFNQANLLELVHCVLSDTGLAPGQLELELTENIVMKDADDAVETLCELRAMGVRLSIGDFGTGYS